jgi:crossover junction endodeoxyribonuclease RusA
LIRLELPWPPSVNAMYANVRGRRVKTKEAKKYEKNVSQICLYNRVNRMFEGAIKVSIDAYPPDRRRRDIDNILKSLLDSIQSGGVYKDDSQIIELSIRKNPPAENGYVNIFIEEIGAANYG